MNLSTYRSIIVIIGLILVIIGFLLVFSKNNEFIGTHLCTFGLGFEISCIISYLIKYYEE